MSQLNFDSLFKQAIVMWPNELDLTQIQYVTPDFLRYIVKGLGAISDDIGEKYINKENEIIWRELHESICEAIHAAAKFSLKIRLSDIRVEAVRFIFEKRLKKSASAQDSYWSQEDFYLVESYFIQNQSERDESMEINGVKSTGKAV